MSRVATAQTPATSQPAPTTLSRFWFLRPEQSSLTGKLTAIDIMAQLPTPAVTNVNRVLGGVWDIDNKNLYSMLAGHTDLVEKEGRVQQVVSFEIIYEGSRYTFGGGVLSPDGTQISGKSIERSPLDGGGDPTLVEDGTWSAQASPGGPGEELGKPKPRGRTKSRRR
jgi:hypothetical protein